MSYVFDDELLSKYYEGALYQVERIKLTKAKKDSWVWSSNFLREYARCRGAPHTNDRSPGILRKLGTEYPWLKPYIDLGTLTKAR